MVVLFRFVIITSIAVLAACGGGGGSESSLPTNSVAPVDGGQTSPPPPVIIEPTGLNQKNAGKVAGVQLEFIRLAAAMAQEWTSNQRLNPQGIDPVIPVGKNTFDCDLGGQVSIELSSDRQTLLEDYTDCIQSLNGEKTTVSGSVKGVVDHKAETVSRQFTNYSVSANGLTEKLNGRIFLNVLDKLVVMNLEVESSLEGNISVQGLKIGFEDYFGFVNYLTSVNRASGVIERSAIGKVTLSLLEKNRIQLSSGADDYAELHLASQGHTILFYEEGKSAASLSLYIDNRMLDSYSFFDDALESTPYLRTTFTGDIGQLTLIQREETALYIGNKFSDFDGDLLRYEAKVISIALNPERYVNVEQVYVPLDDPTTDYYLRSTSAGEWVFASSTPGQDLTYKIAFTAVDLTGRTSPNELILELEVKGDFDNDGILDEDDDDVDNDGYFRWEDEFPYDPTEHVDSDGDGIGDAGDTDNDNDGVINTRDAYPNDSACSTIEEGDGEHCYSTLLASSQTSADIDSKGVVYFRYQDSNVLVRYDIPNQRYLQPLELFPQDTGVLVSQIRMSPDRISLAVFYSDGQLQVFNVEGESAVKVADIDSPDVQGGNFPPQLVNYSEFLIRVSLFDGFSRFIELLDFNGDLLDSLETEENFYTPERSIFQTSGITIELSDGSPQLVLFEHVAESTSYYPDPSYTVSPDQRFYVAIYADIFDFETHMQVADPYDNVRRVQSAWSEDHGLMMLVQQKEAIQLDQYDENLNLAQSWLISEGPAIIYMETQDRFGLWRIGDTYFFITAEREEVITTSARQLKFHSLLVD